jgi:hypothetical protein
MEPTMLLFWGVVVGEAFLMGFHKSGSFKEKTKLFGSATHTNY